MIYYPVDLLLPRIGIFGCDSATAWLRSSQARRSGVNERRGLFPVKHPSQHSFTYSFKQVQVSITEPLCSVRASSSGRLGGAVGRGRQKWNVPAQVS